MTSDVHGYVFPYSYATGKDADQGFAKVSSTIKELKDENTILIDNGDVLEGSPLAYYHFEKRKGEENLKIRLKSNQSLYIGMKKFGFTFGKI